MPQVTLNGARFYYEEKGDGFPIIFTHGLAIDSSMWSSQIPVFSKEYRTITWDVRGHGKSEITETGYSIDQFADDLYALLRHLGVMKTHVVGLSMGGWTSWTFASAHPELCRSLVLSDSAGVTVKTTGKGVEQIRDMLGAGAHIAEKYGMEKLTDTNIIFMYAPEFISSNPDIVETTKKRMADSSGEGFARAVRNMFVPQLDVHFDTIKEKLQCLKDVPTLIITGDKDILTPMDTQKELHNAIPGSRLEVLPGSGHMPPVEMPDSWNRVVMDFIKGIE